MSLELALLIDKRRDNQHGSIGFERLSFTWHDESVLKKLKEEALPLEQFVSDYGDEGVQSCSTDPYGDPLTYLSASDLTKIFRHIPLDHYNEAVLTFLNTLPRDTKIVLWWY